jgi:glucose-6-phosphate dehydrogenase assembly protein OpcA
MRMRGRLALHAESVVMPLLAPDVPVVTWWLSRPPDRIAYDPLGVGAEGRITDTTHADDPMAALRVRAEDFAPGDTDLAWTRITPWRSLVAGVFDATEATATSVTITASDSDPSAALLSGWLAARLGIRPELRPVSAPSMRGLTIGLSDGGTVDISREDGTAQVRRTGLPDRDVPLVDRPVGEELAEELRRLDPDQIYAAALAAATGSSGLADRPRIRVHVWNDPALAERPDSADAAGTDAGATGHQHAGVN